TPVGWLERVPTYKEMVEQLGLESPSYGLLGYPLLQAADILMYKAQWVPVGADQVPHIELTREVARRFNNTWKPVFPEPQARLTQIPKVPGTDGRKMSKSYGNAIYLPDTTAEITEKIKPMVTDPARKRRSDPGNPDVCPVFDLHRIFTPDGPRAEVAQGCRTAGIGCLDCKAVLLEHMLPPLAEIRERRQRFVNKPTEIVEILREGSKRARRIAVDTMTEVPPAGDHLTARSAARGGAGSNERAGHPHPSRPGVRGPDRPRRIVRGAAGSAAPSLPHQRDGPLAALAAHDHRPVPEPSGGGALPGPGSGGLVHGHGRHPDLSQVQAAPARQSGRSGGDPRRGRRAAQAGAGGAPPRVRAGEGPRHLARRARVRAEPDLRAHHRGGATARVHPARRSLGAPAAAGDAATHRGSEAEPPPADRGEPAVRPRAHDRDHGTAPQHVVAPLLLGGRRRARAGRVGGDAARPARAGAARPGAGAPGRPLRRDRHRAARGERARARALCRGRLRRVALGGRSRGGFPGRGTKNRTGRVTGCLSPSTSWKPCCSPRTPRWRPSGSRRCSTWNRRRSRASWWMVCGPGSTPKAARCR